MFAIFYIHCPCVYIVHVHGKFPAQYNELSTLFIATVLHPGLQLHAGASYNKTAKLRSLPHITSYTQRTLYFGKAMPMYRVHVCYTEYILKSLYYIQGFTWSGPKLLTSVNL